MTDPDLLGFIQRLDQHALQNYEQDGWDFWLETYTHSDKLEVVEGALTFEQALEKASKSLELMNDRREEIQSTAF